MARYPDSRQSARKRGYDGRWERYRAGYLREHPLCVRCERAGLVVASSVVDHVTPHRGDPRLFWDPANHQALCATCHSGDKQREEKGGRRGFRGCGVDGMPLDPDHRWRRGHGTPLGGGGSESLGSQTPRTAPPLSSRDVKIEIRNVRYGETEEAG